MNAEISYEFTDSLNDYIALKNEKTFDDWLHSLSDEAIMKLKEQLGSGIFLRRLTYNEFKDIVHLLTRMVSLKQNREVPELTPDERDVYMFDLYNIVLNIIHAEG
jgi:hypothetical protein